MANIFAMVIALQELALTEGARMLLTPTYHAFDLHKPCRSATPLKASSQSPILADDTVQLALVNADSQRPARVLTNLRRGSRTHPDHRRHGRAQHLRATRRAGGSPVRRCIGFHADRSRAAALSGWESLRLPSGLRGSLPSLSLARRFDPLRQQEH